MENVLYILLVPIFFLIGTLFITLYHAPKEMKFFLPNTVCVLLACLMGSLVIEILRALGHF